jgi:hypothetical protein
MDGAPARSLRPGLGALAALALLTGTTTAAAGPRTSSFAWVRLPGAEGCSGARALAEAVERRLGRPVFVAPTLGDVIIEGRIERVEGPGAFRATINVFDRAGAWIGRRELESPRAECQAIDDELELVVALLIDPAAALGPPPPAPPALPPIAPVPAPLSPVAAPPPTVAPPHAPAPPPVPERPWRLAIAGGATIGLGLLPGDAAGGVALWAQIAPPRGPSFEVGGAVWIDHQVTLPGGDASFSLAYGWIAVCPFDASLAGSTLTACLGPQVGSLRVAGAGFPSAFRQEQAIVSILAGARARRRFVGPLFGTAGLGITVPTLRDRFYYTDPQGVRREVFQASPVAGTGDLALGFELP